MSRLKISRKNVQSFRWKWCITCWTELGSGCGAVGKEVTSNTRDLRFDPVIGNFIYHQLYWNTKKEKKRPGMAQHFHWIVPLANGMGMFPNIKFPKTLTTYQPTYLPTYKEDIFMNPKDRRTKNCRVWFHHYQKLDKVWTSTLAPILSASLSATFNAH